MLKGVSKLHGYLPRKAESELRRALGRSPAVAILGPRQCGKSTLARQYLKGQSVAYLDLQNRIDLNRLAEPELFLEQHRQELVCLDEIQRLPEFFVVLRSEIDRDRRPGRFLILGSASRGFFELVGDLQPENAWVIAPVDEAYEYQRGVRVANLDFAGDESER